MRYYFYFEKYQKYIIYRYNFQLESRCKQKERKRRKVNKTMSRGGELVFKTKKTSEKISENIHIFANDPSLAFFRVQEHVRKVSPAIFEKRDEVLQLQNNLQGHCYDMEYGIQ